MSGSTVSKRRLWPYLAAVVVLAAVVPALPIGAGESGLRFRFALLLPILLAVVAAVAALRHPALGAVWMTPAVAIVAVAGSALAYSARGILEILAVTFVLTLVGSVCGAGWTRLGAVGAPGTAGTASTDERTKS